MKTRRSPCGLRRGKRRGRNQREFATYLEMYESDRRRRRRTAIGRRRGVSTPSPLESLEVGLRFGLVFSRESGFRDYLGFFF